MQKGGLPLNRKFIILSLYFFSTICLFSVGFSSWTICMGDKLTAKGNIVAENVISYQEVIDYNKDKDTDAIDDGIQVFNYFSGGLLDENNQITNSAKLILYLQIDLNNYLSAFYPGTEYDSNKVYNANVLMTLSDINGGGFSFINDSLITSINTNESLEFGSLSTNYSNGYYTISYDVLNLMKNYDPNNATNNVINYEVEISFTMDRFEFINNAYPALKNGLCFIADVKMEAGN